MVWLPSCVASKTPMPKTATSRVRFERPGQARNVFNRGSDERGMVTERLDRPDERELAGLQASAPPAIDLTQGMPLDGPSIRR